MDGRKGSSTLREVLALLFALIKALSNILTGQKVRAFVDNQNVERVQGKVSFVPALAHVAEQRFFLCKLEAIHLSI